MRRAMPWLALLCLAACTTTPTADPVSGPAALPPKLAGLGTEPFWNFTLEAGVLSYTTLEAPEARSARVLQRMIGKTIALEGSLAGQPLRARITHQPCSDGMSDRRYPMAVALTIEGRDLSGCAYPADNPPPAE